MSEYNFDLEMPAKTTALQLTDQLIVMEASSGVKKSITGSLLNAGAASGVVISTATALSLTITQHAGKVVIVNTNSTVANTFTLPVATGSGAKFEIINGIAQTQGSVVVAANGTDIMKGRALAFDSTAVATHQSFFVTTATSDKVTWNRSTTGGIGQDRCIAYDESANTWHVFVEDNCSGSVATPFSET